ncbi:MAG: hypothetical protein IJ652_04920, partial [Bacteroidales bacterium]|nr:hypothetical protein [Bacteroidales bacterium]
LESEIFRLLFESAEIATFAPKEKVKYENDMTTERDIRNQIAYARQEGIEKGLKQGVLTVARNLKASGIPIETIVRTTGLTIEQIQNL